MKTSKQVILVLLLLIGILLYFFRNDRTSSKDRLEKIANVVIPNHFKVIKDEYQDMWQDYWLIYEIQFDKNGMSNLINSIETSIKTNKSWTKSVNGYNFETTKERTLDLIKVDTFTNILKYDESLD